jgi:putative membrane protein
VRRALQILVAMLLVGLVSAPVAGWAGSDRHDGKPTHKVSAQDRRFAKKAASANLFEIKSSLVALRRSKDDDVRAFAKLLIVDHARQSVKLARIAEAKDIELPKAPSKAQRAVIEHLVQVRKKKFDCAYLSAQVAAHLKAIALFKQEVHKGRSKKLRAFAAKGLPVLRHHLHIAKELRREEGCHS